MSDEEIKRLSEAEKEAILREIDRQKMIKLADELGAFFKDHMLQKEFDPQTGKAVLNDET